MNDNSEIKSNNPRRKFMKQISSSLAAALALPSLGISNTLDKRPPSIAKFVTQDEKYWELIKQQFTVPPNMMMVNSANLCPSPYFINEEVFASSLNLSKDVSFQNRGKFREQRQKSINLLADYLGVLPEELGITRNTSESNNIVVNGFDFKPNDEVIIWEQNHPSNNIAWKQQAKRFGFSIKSISVPTTPKSSEELLIPFTNAITEKTKLIAFSHISNVSGIALPANEICKIAKDKGILTLIDGAQGFGFLDLNLKDIGCDFYTGSTHKWLMGPMENGILYVNRELRDRIWPNIVGAGWSEDAESTDGKLCNLGQRNNPTTSALSKIVDFHHNIGKTNVENRVRELTAHLKKEIREKIKGVTFTTPLPKDLSGGIVIFNLPGKEPANIFQRLYHEFGIACAPTGGIRISPHIHNTLKDMDKIVEALVKLA